MPFRAPALRWPFDAEKWGRLRAADVISDHAILQSYCEITRLLDRLDFLLGEGVNISVADNLYWELAPVTDSVIYSIQAHAKSPGAGDLILRIRINGVVESSYTLPGGSGAVNVFTPAQTKVSPTDKISIDCTSVSGNWQWVTFTVVLEPRPVWEV